VEAGAIVTEWSCASSPEHQEDQIEEEDTWPEDEYGYNAIWAEIFTQDINK